MLIYNGEYLYIRQAPEPEDIIWKNLNESLCDRIYGLILAWFFTIILLGICFVANYFILRLNTYLTLGVNQIFVAFLISVASSILILLVNLLIKILIPIFTIYFEKKYTYTSLHFSIALKLSISYFINSAIIPLIAQNGNYFQNGGLLFSVWLNWLFFAIGMPILEAINPKYIFYYLKRIFLKNKGDRSDLTQIEANIAFEPPQVYMPENYGNIIGLMFYTAFYFTYFPIGTIFTILGLLLSYFVDKVS